MEDPAGSLGGAMIGNLWAVSWQVSVLVILVWLISIAARRASPAFRYGLWCIVLVRLCLPVSLLGPLGVGQLFRSVAVPVPGAEDPRPSVYPAAAAGPGDSALVREPGSVPENVSVATPGSRSHDTGYAGVPARPSVTAVLAGLWLAGVVTLLSLVLLRVLWTRRMVGNCSPVNRPGLLETLEDLRKAVGIPRPVQLRVASGARGPAVIGFLYPTILLPAPIAGNWALHEIEPLLLHELGHIKRRDLLVNWVQIVVQIIYFFHPLVWFANWKVRRERELACDDLAVGFAARGKKGYTESFLRMVEESREGFALGLAGVGMTEPRDSIAGRILRIMDHNYRSHKRLGRAGSFALVLLAFFLFIVSGDRGRAEGETPGTDAESVEGADPLPDVILMRGAPAEHAESTHRPAPPSEDPLVYLSFDNGNATDDSDHGHNGLIHGDPEFVQGVRGKGVRFDGSGEWIEVPGQDLAGPIITASVWVFVENGIEGVILAKGAWLGSDAMNYGIGFEMLSRHLPTCVNVGTEDSDDDNDYWVSFEFPDGSGEWVHIVQVLTDEKNALYVNAELESMARMPLKFLPYLGPAPLQIGGDPLCTKDMKGRFFNGVVDEVRIYNRALSADEIRGLFQKGRRGGG